MSKVVVATVEQLDEMRARAMFAVAFDGYPPNEKGETPKWEDNDVHVWMIQDQLRKFARAVREADERAGLVTVPREPTAGMARFGGVQVEIRGDWRVGSTMSDEEARECWQAMISYSPLAKADEA